MYNLLRSRQDFKAVYTYPDAPRRFTLWRDLNRTGRFRCEVSP